MYPHSIIRSYTYFVFVEVESDDYWNSEIPGLPVMLGDLLPTLNLSPSCIRSLCQLVEVFRIRVSCHTCHTDKYGVLLDYHRAFRWRNGESYEILYRTDGLHTYCIEFIFLVCLNHYRRSYNYFLVVCLIRCGTACASVATLSHAVTTKALVRY